eukprot:TRINITY_DN45782_c0_g1_i1.p1 TRINITY_DN45782_c0_g1~~TRINITY_DN45782_c0_g1_i1.p1  ORF type:complete len:372 (+),score=45.10 TRINITY_DN45782_c0_g1_i1:128-1117(+)
MAEIEDAVTLKDISSLPQTRSFSGQGAWVTDVGSGLAILSGDGGRKVTFWNGGSDFKEVDLGNMVTPVGAAYLEGRLYVACFGSWPDPAKDSGLAVIDVASATLVSTHPFSDPRLHIHNAYAFDVNGRKDIFVAVLGNPWTGPVAGKALARFDRATSTFDLETTDTDLNVRSAKQQRDGSIFVLTQEPSGQQTKLARLEPKNSKLVVVAQTSLPRLPAGAGGADVVLGREENTVWVTDRQNGAPGKLYFYTYSSGEFTLVSSRNTGITPRYTVMLENGDMVTCNQDGADLSFYEGIGLHPNNSSAVEKRIKTLKGPMFFMESSTYTISV